MGEMCDFEAEFFPENWDETPSPKKRKKRGSKITATLNDELREKYRRLGGAYWLRKTIAAAAIEVTAKCQPD